MGTLRELPLACYPPIATIKRLERSGPRARVMHFQEVPEATACDAAPFSGIEPSLCLRNDEHGYQTGLFGSTSNGIDVVTLQIKLAVIVQIHGPLKANVADEL